MAFFLQLGFSLNFYRPCPILCFLVLAVSGLMVRVVIAIPPMVGVRFVDEMLD
jgi:hypothetical protein